MRFATLEYGNGSAAAIDFVTHYQLTPFEDLASLLRGVGGDLQKTADLTLEVYIPKEEARYLPGVTTPSKIICLGLNYYDHVKEMGHDTVSYPTLFAKFPSTLTGPYDDIEIPSVSDAVDWEVELGVVVGKPARNVTEDQAKFSVAGFVVANDVSMRDFQRRTSQFLQGKIFERSTPVGPELVTPDEVDYAKDLIIECYVDDEKVQSSRTSKMVTSVSEAISYISRITTLEPGDLILTGTPSGVGAGRTPPVFLHHGQVLRSYIEGVGELRNRFIKAST
ncbi:acylpyruvate hydrolase [Ferrithrix thermotolerans DSM 19514]|uniref:Acylpyruvate hydrolase n=1 Tax=Ferrithrix thermotolerans DSM 19514 TaxID=1121881 RepID=A0A1M4X618_9ACTN|nr:fumarylacetoacetate hydrolase family protein [Ferrithrix thermotolerans]SHE88929.1 acylpyruvate hydrolase [Ferrithrix thermotolerans DSM 19514]